MLIDRGAVGEPNSRRHVDWRRVEAEAPIVVFAPTQPHELGLLVIATTSEEKVDYRGDAVPSAAKVAQRPHYQVAVAVLHIYCPYLSILLEL
jgi:hypothetical protein